MKKPRLGKEIMWDENVELPPPVIFKDELEKEIKRWSKDLRWIRRAFLEIATYGNLLMDPGPFLEDMIKYWYTHDKRVLDNIESELRKVKKEIENAAPYDENNLWTVYCRKDTIILINYYLELIDALKKNSNPNENEIKQSIKTLTQLDNFVKENAKRLSDNEIEDLLEQSLQAVKKLISAVFLGRVNKEQSERVYKVVRNIAFIKQYPRIKRDLLTKFEIIRKLCFAIHLELKYG